MLSSGCVQRKALSSGWLVSAWWLWRAESWSTEQRPNSVGAGGARWAWLGGWGGAHLPQAGSTPMQKQTQMPTHLWIPLLRDSGSRAPLPSFSPKRPHPGTTCNPRLPAFLEAKASVLLGDPQAKPLSPDVTPCTLTESTWLDSLSMSLSLLPVSEISWDSGVSVSLAPFLLLLQGSSQPEGAQEVLPVSPAQHRPWMQRLCPQQQPGPHGGWLQMQNSGTRGKFECSRGPLSQVWAGQLSC